MASGVSEPFSELLLSPEVAKTLQHHVLPRLGINDLGRLSCTCSALHSLVEDLDMTVWMSFSRGALPSTHPALQSADLATLKRALTSHNLASLNLARGIAETVKLLLWGGNRIGLHGSPPASFSPDGTALAVHSCSVKQAGQARVKLNILKPAHQFMRSLLSSDVSSWHRSNAEFDGTLLGDPLWSADSQRIFMVIRAAGKIVITAVSRDCMPCYQHQVSDDQPWLLLKQEMLSPDGRFLLLPTRHQGSQAQVTHVSTATSVPGLPALVTKTCRVLWNPRRPLVAAVVADGVPRGYVRAAQGDGRVCNKVFDIAAGTELWAGPVESEQRTGQPAAWSPDGRLLHLAYPGWAAGRGRLYPAICQVLDVVTWTVVLACQHAGGTDTLPSLHGDCANASFSPNSSRLDPCPSCTMHLPALLLTLVGLSSPTEHM